MILALIDQKICWNQVSLYYSHFKCKTKALGTCGTGNFWEISDEVLNKIEGVNYLENKLKHNKYLKDNPIVAKKKFINIH